MSILLFRVMYKGTYLFHCSGHDLDDAMKEAKIIAERNGYKPSIINNLEVQIAI